MENKQMNLEDLKMEIHEVTEATAMEEMGASIGEIGCCSVVLK